MRLTFRIGIALLVVASMGVVVGSSGFSSTEADRSVSVKVVDDGSAYVGLDGVVVDDDEELAVSRAGNVGGSNNRGTNYTATYSDAAVVANKFTEDVTVSVTVVEDERAPETELSHSDSNVTEVFIGEEATFDAKVRCDWDPPEDPPSGNVTVEFHVEGESVTATVERETRVVCRQNSNLNT